MSGPEFLALYAALAVGANLLFRGVLTLRERDRRGVSTRFAQDPYRLAVLGGAPRDAISTAIFSLLDRGLLVANQAQLQRAAALDAPAGLREIERAIWDAAGVAMPYGTLARNAEVAASAGRYEAELIEQGLVASDACLAARRTLFMGFAGALIGLAALRMAQALVAGHTNLGFLVVLACVSVVMLYQATQDRLTAQGRATLRHMRRVFKRLHDKRATLRPGRASSDATLVVALFGLGVLPATAFAFRDVVFPRALIRSRSPDNSSSSDGGSSDSDSSDSSSSDSGGCGSGGCGGCGGGGD